MRQSFALLIAILSCSVHAQDAFETLPVPVMLDNQYLADATVRIQSSGAVLVEPLPLLATVEAVLSDEVLTRSADLFRSQEWVELSAFSALGIAVSFDLTDLALVVEVPPLVRKTRRLTLSGNRVEPSGTPVVPSQFSLITNLDMWSRITYEDSWVEAGVTPELAVRISDVVLAAQGGLRTGAEPFSLDYVRLIWDVPEIGYRVEVGDLTWRDTSLVNVSGLTGLSLFRESSIAGPHSSIDRVLDRFFLSQDSTVEVYVNEARRQRRTLEAGNYELANVPLGDGVNTILVLWEESDTRLVELVIPHDSELRAVGELDTGVAIAVANRNVLRPMMLAYQRYGVTPGFTIGARQGFAPLDLQVDLALDSVLATTVGNFMLTPAVGIGPDDRFMIDVPLRYSFLNSSPSSYLSFGLSAAYQSVVGDSVPQATQNVTASGYVNLALPDGFSIVPRATYRHSLTDGSQQVDVRASLRRAIRGGSSVSGDVGFAWDGELRFSATVTFSASFPDAQQNLYLQQNLETQEFSAYWARYAGEESPAFDYSVSTRIPADLSRNATLNGRIGFGNRLLETSLSHSVFGAFNTGDLRNTTALALQSGLVFTDGIVAMTSPVSGSFALVVPGAEFAGEEITVRTGGDEFQSTGGAAVLLPNISNYASTGVTVTGSSVGFGMADGELSYAVQPAYRSGTLIVAQPELSVYVAGRLADDDGGSVELEVGTYTDEDGTQASFFTDEEGFFELYGLTPGPYTLEMPSLPNQIYGFVIGPDAREFVDLGTLEPEAEEGTP